MKRSGVIAGIGFAWGVIGLAAGGQGCGGSTTNATGGVDASTVDSGADGGREGGSATPEGGPGLPPPKPPGPVTPENGTKNFAIYTLSLGESDRSGAARADAWKTYGYNLDGLVTTKGSVDVCTRAQGASAAVQDDGVDGIDNSFGKNIVPLLQSFSSTPSTAATSAIQDGTSTDMFDIRGLTDDAQQTNTGLAGRVLVGATFRSQGGQPARPTFTIADDWPYRVAPITQISDAYIRGGTFVGGGADATVSVSIGLAGSDFVLKIHRAIITFDHTAPDALGNGTIAGILSTTELEDEFRRVAGRISVSLCSGGTLDSIVQTVRQARDIMLDGNNRAGVPCDGISVGIGFTAKRIGDPKTTGSDPAAPDPCLPADAGAD